MVILEAFLFQSSKNRSMGWQPLYKELLLPANFVVESSIRGCRGNSRLIRTDAAAAAL